MQSKKVKDFILFSVPADMLSEAGINTENVIQMSASEGKIVIETLQDIGEIVCDNDCGACPINEYQCYKKGGDDK